VDIGLNIVLTYPFFRWSYFEPNRKLRQVFFIDPHVFPETYEQLGATVETLYGFPPRKLGHKSMV